MVLLGEIAETFRLFGELECPGMSPLYERLSLGVSSDPEVLAIAANRREGQPAPNLFFAAVHAVLAKEKSHRLARFYPDLSEDPDRGDPYPAFRGFCLERRGADRRDNLSVGRPDQRCPPERTSAPSVRTSDRKISKEAGLSTGLSTGFFTVLFNRDRRQRGAQLILGPVRL